MKKIISLALVFALIISTIPAVFASDSGWSLPDPSVVSTEATQPRNNLIKAGKASINQSFRIRYDPSVLHVVPEEYIYPGFTLAISVVDLTTGKIILMDDHIETVFSSWPVNLNSTEMVITHKVNIDTTKLVGHKVSVRCTLVLDGAEEDPVYDCWSAAAVYVVVSNGSRLIGKSIPEIPVPVRPGTRSR